MTKVALLIGVSEYEPGLNPLPAAIKDVAALKRVLSDSEMGEFDEVKVLTNPDCQDMQYEIETLFSDRHKDDFVLLFFSGHGVKDDSNNLYFASRITRKSQKGTLVISTAVPAQFIHKIMKKSRAKRQVLILDCCFSGAFDPALQSKDDGSVDLKTQLGSEGRVVLTSSSSTQYSFEQEGADLSLYTRYLIEGIETGAGDHNEDGKISARELHDYATSKVQETAPSMTPKLITLKDMGFDIVLAKAKITDPQLSYRRQVEKYANHGQISSIGRTILNKLQSKLRITPEVAQEIEAKVLKPYKERLENLQHYRQMFSEAIEREYPLGARVKSELQDLRKVLGLRPKDIALIEQELSEQTTQLEEAAQLEPQNKLKYAQGVKKNKQSQVQHDKTLFNTPSSAQPSSAKDVANQSPRTETNRANDIKPDSSPDIKVPTFDDELPVSLAAAAVHPAMPATLDSANAATRSSSAIKPELMGLEVLGGDGHNLRPLGLTQPE